jgi:hypothetical protein
VDARERVVPERSIVFEPHPRSFEAIDDVRKLLEKSVARRKRLVEAACGHEIQSGIGELVETVVFRH